MRGQGTEGLSEGTRSPLRPLMRRYWLLALLLLTTFVLALVVHHVVYPAYSWNRDEPVYLWQVANLREGRIFASGGATPLFFQPWLSGITGNMFFSQYTLGWPLVILVGDVLGASALAIAFGAALAVLGTYCLARELTRDDRLSLVAAALMAACPLLIVQSGVYLSYLFSLGLGLLFGAAWLAGVRRRSRALLISAGALVGYLFMTRPFDAVMWGAAFGAYALVVTWRDWRALARGIGWAALGFAPLLIATLLYNRHVTGSLTTFPIVAADPRDTFGFGTKGIGTRWPSTYFGVRRAVRGVVDNLWALPPFLVGSWVGLSAVFAGLWLRRRDRSTLALLFVALAFVGGYFFFWGIYLSSTFASVSGPIYYIPLYPLACMLIATTLLALWAHRRTFGLIGLACVFVATVPYLALRVRQNHRLSETQVPWREAATQFDDRALVFVENSGPYLLHLNPFSRNTAELSGPILYATDRGYQNFDLIARHPDRTAYVEWSDVPRDTSLGDPNAPKPHITVEKVTEVRSREFRVDVRVTNPFDQPIAVVSFSIGAQEHRVTLSTDARQGQTFETDVILTTAATQSGAPNTLVLPEPGGSLIIKAGFADSPDRVFSVSHFRQRYDVRVEGDSIRVMMPGRNYLAQRFDEGFLLQRISEISAMHSTFVPVP